jgi:hypothetical protein
VVEVRRGAAPPADRAARDVLEGQDPVEVHVEAPARPVLTRAAPVTGEPGVLRPAPPDTSRTGSRPSVEVSGSDDSFAAPGEATGSQAGIWSALEVGRATIRSWTPGHGRIDPAGPRACEGRDLGPGRMVP